MKTALFTFIAIVLMFLGQAVADDGLEGIANPSITEEELEELLATESYSVTWAGTTCRISWEPKKDITTYELALCMKVMLQESSVYELPKKAARHFHEVCQ